MNERSPIVSEFATSEKAAAYERWLRAKVAASLEDERKLLDKQKEGKKRMREYGLVSIPQEAFIAALRMGEE